MSNKLILIIYLLTISYIDCDFHILKETDYINQTEPKNQIFQSNHDIDINESKELFKKYSYLQIIVTPNFMYMEGCLGNITEIEQYYIKNMSPVIKKLQNITSEHTTNFRSDSKLMHCITNYCELGNKNIGLNCSNQRIRHLQIDEGPQDKCLSDIYSINLQYNNIAHIKLQSLMKKLIHLVEFDLRNNPIISFNYKSFRPMTMLRILRVSYSENVINEVTIKHTIEFTHFKYFDCSIDSIICYAFYSCRNQTFEFFLENKDNNTSSIKTHIFFQKQIESEASTKMFSSNNLLIHVTIFLLIILVMCWYCIFY